MDYYYKIEKLLKDKKLRDEQRIKDIEEDTLNTYYEVGKLLDRAYKEERKNKRKGEKMKYEKKDNNNISCSSFNFTI